VCMCVLSREGGRVFFIVYASNAVHANRRQGIESESRQDWSISVFIGRQFDLFNFITQSVYRSTIP